MDTEKTALASWATRQGTRRVTLYRDPYGYSYRGDGTGGSFPADSDEHAVATMEEHAIAVLRADFPSVVREKEVRQ